MKFEDQVMLVKRKGRLVAVLLYGSSGQVNENSFINVLDKEFAGDACGSYAIVGHATHSKKTVHWLTFSLSHASGKVDTQSNNIVVNKLYFAKSTF